MASPEKKTFLPYSRPIGGGMLRIGHLALDIYNPTIGAGSRGRKWCVAFSEERVSNQQYEDIIRDYTGEPEVNLTDSIHVERTRTRTRKLNGQVPGVLSGDVGDDEPATREEITVKGRTRRFVVKRPNRFLLDRIEPMQHVRNWVSDVATIQASGRAGMPDIWLCTGLCLVSGATFKSESTKRESTSGKIGRPKSGKAPGFEISGREGSVLNSKVESTFDDERVYAAQWSRLRIDFRQRRSGDDDVRIIGLREVEGLDDGLRSSAGDPTSAAAEDGGAADSRRADVAEIVGLRTPLNTEVVDDETDISWELDDQAYAEAMEGINWEEYEAYEEYLRDLDED